MRMVVAGSPGYFERHPRRVTPHDLTQHNCINLRLPTLGGLYAWEFEQDGRPINVRVQGQFVCNDVAMILVDRPRWAGRCLPALRSLRSAREGRTADPGFSRLVSFVSRIPSLIPEPPSRIACLHTGGRRPALSMTLR
ncbi:hypothetical protein [Ensifer sp. Root127]|uniref:hypothetical protein n=1 Tax=unclassified Ensifer TaxID=2633371 RepID=UPI0032AFD8AC